MKKRFPDLKIGGPALAWNEQWTKEFLSEMQKRKVEIDFFSWHIYCTEPKYLVEKAERIKKLMNVYGYEKAESILNEWNYIKGWTKDYVYSLKAIHGIKGAAFIMACMSEAQKSSIDMLMYYDTRPSFAAHSTITHTSRLKAIIRFIGTECFTICVTKRDATLNPKTSIRCAAWTKKARV